MDPWVPFWRSGRMDGESLLFTEPAPGTPATSTLLAIPSGPVSLQSATGEVKYVESVDYTLEAILSLLAE